MDKTQRTLDEIIIYINENSVRDELKEELLDFIDCINHRKINMFDVIRGKQKLRSDVVEVIKLAYNKAVKVK